MAGEKSADMGEDEKARHHAFYNSAKNQKEGRNSL